MTKIKVSAKEGNIIRIQIAGHTGAADAGEDLVCAGISSIVVGSFNALDELYPEACMLKLKKGQADIDVKKNSESLQQALLFLEKQLCTVQEKYPEFVKYTRKEV